MISKGVYFVKMCSKIFSKILSLKVLFQKYLQKGFSKNIRSENGGFARLRVSLPPGLREEGNLTRGGGVGSRVHCTGSNQDTDNTCVGSVGGRA